MIIVCFVCLGFIVPLENFHSYEDVTSISEGLQFLTYARLSLLLSSVGSLACHKGHSFIMVRDTHTLSQAFSSGVLTTCPHLFLRASPKAKAGLGVQSLRPSVRPSQNLVIATPLKLLFQLSWNLVCRSDIICSYAYRQEILIPLFLWEVCPLGTLKILIKDLVIATPLKLLIRFSWNLVVDRTSYVVMHIGRKFWSPHFCRSYAFGT